MLRCALHDVPLIPNPYSDRFLVLTNVFIINDNVQLAIRKLNTLQEDMGVSIRNENILSDYQDKLIADVKQIKHIVNNLSS